MLKKQSQAYLMSLELMKKAEKEGYVGPKRKEVINGYTYYNYTEGKVLSTKGKFAYVKTDIFQGLSQRAIVTVCKIMAELKNNNALWHFDQRLNSKDSAVITELRKKEILFRTEKADIHYVNPFCIRAGMIGNTIFRMLELLQNTSGVTTDHIKKLAWSGKVKASAIDYISSD